jgi:hypothetical protein
VECTYENPTDEPIYGGYGSYDEMCFNFSYIAVRSGEAATEEASRERPGRDTPGEGSGSPR